MTSRLSKLYTHLSPTEHKFSPRESSAPNRPFPSPKTVFPATRISFADSSPFLKDSRVVFWGATVSAIPMATTAQLFAQQLQERLAEVVRAFSQIRDARRHVKFDTDPKE